MRKTRKLVVSALGLTACLAMGAGIGAAYQKVGAEETDVPAAETSVDFYVRGASVRVIDDEYGPGIRFHVVMGMSEYENLQKQEGYKTGTLVCPAAKLTQAAEPKIDLTTPDAVEIETTEAWRETEIDGTTVMESVAYIYDIDALNYGSDLYAVGYYQETDKEPVYTEMMNKPVSMSWVAKEEYNDPASKLTEQEKESLKKYTTFKLTYTDGEKVTETTAEYGSTLTDLLEEPTKDGYEFVGWFNKDFTAQWDLETDTVKGNTSLHAKFNPVDAVQAWIENNADAQRNTGNSTKCETTKREITDAEYTALLNAGYDGEKTQKTASQIAVSVMECDRANLYVRFGYTMNKLLQAAKEEAYTDAHVSIWMKSNQKIDFEYRKTVFTAKGEVCLDAENIEYFVVDAGQWKEKEIPLSSFVTLGINVPTAEAYGFSFIYADNSAEYLRGAKIDIWSVELKLAEKSTYAETATDASLPETIYGAYTISVKDATGADATGVTVENGMITAANEGEYTIEYTLEKPLYEGVTVLTRELRVESRWNVDSATVLDGMTDAETVQAYIENNAVATRYTGNGTKCETTIREISDEEYTALLNAGYDGEKTQKTAAQIAVSVMECERANLYVRLGSTQTNEIFRAALEANYTDAYVSIWMKSSQTIDFNCQQAIFHADGAVGYDQKDWAGIKGAPDTWIEVKIPLSSFIALGESDGTTAYGFAFDDAHNGTEYLRGAKLDIWSVELRLSEKSAQAGTAVDISISEAVYGTYTIRVKDATGADATGVTVENGKITAENAGEYTIEYALNDARYRNSIIMKVKLTVTAE